MTKPKDNFIEKAVATYPEVLQSLNAFEELVRDECVTAFKTLLPKLNESFGIKLPLSQIKRYKGHDADGAFLEFGLNSGKQYVCIGIWWIHDPSLPRPDTYAAMYCPSKQLAQDLAAKFSNENLEAEAWGSDWYLVSYRPVQIGDADSMGEAFTKSANELLNMRRQFNKMRRTEMG